MRALLVRKTEGGPQHFGTPLPAEIHLNFSLMVISEPQHLPGVLTCVSVDKTKLYPNFNGLEKRVSNQCIERFLYYDPPATAD